MASTVIKFVRRYFNTYTYFPKKNLGWKKIDGTVAYQMFSLIMFHFHCYRFDFMLIIFPSKFHGQFQCSTHIRIIAQCTSVSDNCVLLTRVNPYFVSQNKYFNSPNSQPTGRESHQQHFKFIKKNYFCTTQTYADVFHVCKCSRVS